MIRGVNAAPSTSMSSSDILASHTLCALGHPTKRDGDGEIDVFSGFHIAVAANSFEKHQPCHLFVYDENGTRVWKAMGGEEAKQKSCHDDAHSFARILCNGLGFFDLNDTEPSLYTTTLKSVGDTDLQLRVRKAVYVDDNKRVYKVQVTVDLQLQPAACSLATVMAITAASAQSMRNANNREREQHEVVRDLEVANEQFQLGMELAVEMKDRLESKLVYQFMVSAGICVA